MITPILPNMIPMRDIKQISDGDRLFYELGHKIRMMDMSYENNWVREGKFKEIDNVDEFLEGDKLLSNLEYLEHHNFMLIKK
jgi:hypothetical protein